MFTSPRFAARARPYSVAPWSVPLLLAVASCGGAPAAAPVQAGQRSANESVGEAMVAQGGTSALGSNATAGASLATSLKAELLPKDSKLKMDGVLLEWPQRTAAEVIVKGTPKVKFSAAVQYDAERIYVGGDIGDKGFVAGRSAASLIIAFPSGGGAYATYEVRFEPGQAGESAGSVKLRGQAVSGAKIVEAPNDGGVSFEASLPWSTFPEAAQLRVGLRGALHYADATGSILATGEGDASDAKRLPALPTEPEQALVDALLAPKGLIREAPKFELYADVAGDAMKERVSVFGNYFTICGPGYREGREFFFRDLGAELVQLEARDLTGRGKADLVVRRRYNTKGGSREHFEVWSLLGGAEPVTTFAHEILVTDGTRKITNAVRAGAKEIEISTAAPVGFSVQTYKEPVTTDVEPVLLPWGAVKSRSFRFDGTKFVRAKEVAQAAEAAPAEKPANAVTQTVAAAPPTPVQKKGGDTAKQLLEQFKKERGVADDVKPKTDTLVHVAEDARPERVMLIGRDIVVFGPGFKGGTSYAYLTLSQFESEGDVREMTTRDLNGDGAADLIVRGVRRVEAQGASKQGAAKVELETLFVYSVTAQGITRVFGIETAREVGAKRVQGLVQFVPAKGGKTFEVDVRPGRAVGWTDKTYPWGQEQPGTGALEPLLLPWGGVASLRYAWDGSKFALSR